MDERIDLLKKNFEEYFKFADETMKRGSYNTAVTLFFKAIAALSDIIILKKEGIIPSSHSSRFRIAEEKYPEIYKILDRAFPFYQDSYTKKMNMETSKLLKEDAEYLKKIAGI